MTGDAEHPRQDAVRAVQTAGQSSDASDAHPLRLQRTLRGWSQGDVAERLMDLGYELGVNLGVAGATVGRWERGVCTPRPPYPKLLCVLFGTTAEELGLTPSLCYAGSGKLDHDMERRRLLQMLAGAAMAPVLGRGRARAGMADGRDVGVDRLAHTLEKPSRADGAAASVVESCILDARRVDDALGSRMAVEVAVPLRRVVRTVLADGPSDGAVKQRFTMTAGDLSQFLAHLSFEMGDHPISLRYLDEALTIAHETDASSLGAYVLGWRGKVARCGGHPREAVAYLESAKSWAEAKGSFGTRAWLAEEEAAALAVLGDRSGAERSLDRARRDLARSEPDEEPPWMYWLSTHSLDYRIGSVHATFGRTESARMMLQRRLATYDPSRIRDRAFVLVQLGEVYVVDKEADEACRLAGEALVIAEGTRSDRVVTLVQKLRVQLKPWERQTSVRSLDDQLAGMSVWSQTATI